MFQPVNVDKDLELRRNDVKHVFTSLKAPCCYVLYILRHSSLHKSKKATTASNKHFTFQFELQHHIQAHLSPQTLRSETRSDALCRTHLSAHNAPHLMQGCTKLQSIGPSSCTGHLSLGYFWPRTAPRMCQTGLKQGKKQPKTAAKEESAVPRARWHLSRF